MFPAFKGQGGRSRQKTYQYQTGDSPATLAQQFQTTPQELINANPGGYPFTNGQTINVPFQPINYNIGQQQQPKAFEPPRPNIPSGFSNPHPYRAPAISALGTEQKKNTRGMQTAFNTYKDAFSQAAQMWEETGTVDQSLLPPSVSVQMASAIGYIPEQMQQQGYVLQGNKWVLPSSPQAGQPNQSTGAAPFGMNAAGQRLDIYGNVWNPATAQRDIYGGVFIQPGETRWERNRKGRLVKVRYLKGGKKEIVKNKGGGSTPQEQPTATTESNITFGAGTG